MEIAIIIPAYIEELTIESVIRAFFAEIPEALIVVVNNNSSDNTLQRSERTIKALGVRGVILNEIRQGKSFAVDRAFREIDADIYVLVDGDMTYPAAAVRGLIQPIKMGNADMVVGDRRAFGRYNRENKRLFHNFGNELIKRMVNIIFRTELNDILSGYRAFSRDFVKNFPILGKGFTLEIEMTLHALDKQFSILELPVEYRDRPPGSFSKLSTVRDGFRVIVHLFEIVRNHRPLAFFGFLSLVSAVLALACGFPVISEFIFTGYILRIPLAILSTGLVITSLIALAIALVLDTIAAHNRFNFRLRIMEPNRYLYAWHPSPVPKQVSRLSDVLDEPTAY